MSKIIALFLFFGTLNAYATEKEACPEISEPKMVANYPKMLAPGIFAFKYDLSKYTTPTKLTEKQSYAKLIEIKVSFNEDNPTESFYYDSTDINKDGEYVINLNNINSKNIYWKDSGVVLDLKNGGICNKTSGRDYFVIL